MQTARRRALGTLALLLLTTLSVAQELPGLRPGVKAPAFKLRDQNRKEQTLESLSGPNGLLLLFFRSADWCPFCKGQLVDLEGAQKAFAAKGIGVAAVSYDSTEILADFARRRSIDYPLLSDTSSKLIDEFGIRNPEGQGIEAGIPYPGFYLIRPDGVIARRFFEGAYVNRITANNVYAYLYGASPLPLAEKTVAGTPHVTVTTSQSDVSVAPGAVVRLVATVTPGAETHVYAPGAAKLQYHEVALTIDPSTLYAATATQYPKSEMLSFPELKEVVPVYTGPTDLAVSVASVVDQRTIPLFAKEPHLTVKGELHYQACTLTVCFAPVVVPVEWSLEIRPLDLDRAPGDIRHQ